MTPRSKQLLQAFGKYFWISFLVKVFVVNLALMSSIGSFFVEIFYFALWGLVYGTHITLSPNFHFQLDIALLFLPVGALYSLIFASVVTLAKSRNPRIEV